MSGKELTPSVVLSTMHHSGSSALSPILMEWFGSRAFQVSTWSDDPADRKSRFMEIAQHRPFFHFGHYDFSFFESVVQDENMRFITLNRDPRDVLVSYVRDDMYMHDIDEKNFESMMLAYINPNFVKTVESAIEWKKPRKNVLVLKFDDLKVNVEECVIKILEFSGFAIDQMYGLSGIVEKYSFSSVAGRQRGEQGKIIRGNGHGLVRRGVSGEWKRCFNSEIQNKFELYLGDLTRELGY